MHELKVQVTEVDARLVLSDGSEVTGVLFANTSGRHGAPESISDVLNDPSRRFVAVREQDTARILVVAKTAIRYAGFRAVDFADLSPRPNQTSLWHSVVTLDGGESFAGEVFIGEMRPERRRVVDVLNAGDPFFLMWVDAQPRLVNSARVVHVCPE